MKRFSICLFSLFYLLLVNSCSILRPVAITSNSPIDTYRYVYITPTSDKTSIDVEVYENNLGVHSNTDSRTINPKEVISGYFMKRGIIILPKLVSEYASQTMIISYAETGRRFVGIGFTTEITLQIISGDTYSVICTCSAEGIGETEADNVRNAINRALSKILT